MHALVFVKEDVPTKQGVVDRLLHKPMPAGQKLLVCQSSDWANAQRPTALPPADVQPFSPGCHGQTTARFRTGRRGDAYSPNTRLGKYVMYRWMPMQLHAEAKRHSRRTWSQGTVSTSKRCVSTNVKLGGLNGGPNGLPAHPGVEATGVSIPAMKACIPPLHGPVHAHFPNTCLDKRASSMRAHCPSNANVFAWEAAPLHQGAPHRLVESCSFAKAWIGQRCGYPIALSYVRRRLPAVQ